MSRAPLALLAPLATTALVSGCMRAPVQTARLTSGALSAQLGQEAAGLVRRGANERALELADRAVTLSPASARAHYDRSAALEALGRSDEAMQELREAERLFGTRDARGMSLAIYGRARIASNRGRCAEAFVAYQEFADLVRARDPAAADMALAYARDCRARRPSEADTAATNATDSVITGEYERVLDIAARTPASQTTPWLDYDRAVALGELGRTDEAVAAFRAAEARFADDADGRRGRAVAIYGRARALARADRCSEARRACDAYATVTGSGQARCPRC